MRESLTGAKIIAVEGNYSGQFSNMFSTEMGIPVDQKILRYDGKPLSSEEIIDQVRGSIH
jgi:pyruvate/2-oxoacid:ferredoxin oxidoreductase alpha subunit